MPEEEEEEEEIQVITPKVDLTVQGTSLNKKAKPQEEEALVEPQEEEEAQMIKVTFHRQVCLLHHQVLVHDSREEKPCGHCTQIHLRGEQPTGPSRTRCAKSSRTRRGMATFRDIKSGVN